MLLTQSRSRHHQHNPHHMGSGSSHSHHGDHHHHHHKGKRNSKSSKHDSTSRLQFWSWIVCGVLCSCMSIDFSIRAFFPRHRHPNNSDNTNAPTTLTNLNSVNNNNEPVDILTPLRPLGATTFSPGPKTLNLQPQTTDGYRFDSLANIRPNPNQHAILIPYRDRNFHLSLFLEYMGPYLQHHFPHAQFTLWVIEQDDAELFNRAWLANVGLREIVKQAPNTSCVIFHDVDLVPNMTSHVPYTTCQFPTQLGSELQHFNWTVPYPAYCGGITSLSLKHWQLINGLGNDYIGWGGEDDDLYHRLRQNGLLIYPTWKDAPPVPRRPPKGHGVFRTISQKAEHHEQKKTHNQYWKTLELLKEMHENSERWKFDGMSDVYYTITATEETPDQFGFRGGYKHIKAMPQKQRDGTIQYHKDVDGAQGKPLAPLEFVHVPFTGGQAITKAAAASNIVWGACHYGQFDEWSCPPGKSGDFQYAPMQFKASFQQAQKPWHIPLLKFLENPMEGSKRFTVVRHPYSRAISFYRYTYDRQHGHAHGFKYHSLVEDPNAPPLSIANYIRDREHPGKLNAFLQDFLIRTHHPHKPDGIELIPQVQFVYHRGLKYVHHVLHYEFLQRDFKNILEKYGLQGVIELPPPERKRKRKKQYVKKYEEKRVPKVTESARVIDKLLWGGGKGEDAEEGAKPPVVDMTLAEIEDEYLLGAQDLADETIAMLNAHFELDFKKFHYAKIKVNATTEAYWNPIQVIPRESSVAKQQNDRNIALNRQKGKGGQQQAPPDKTPKQEQKQKEVSNMIRDTKQEEKEMNNKEEGDDANFEKRKSALEDRLKDTPKVGKSVGGIDPPPVARESAGSNGDEAPPPQVGHSFGAKKDNPSAAMLNMRKIAEKLREKTRSTDDDKVAARAGVADEQVAALKKRGQVAHGFQRAARG